MTISQPDILFDTCGRPLQSLRISVIDRCDLRCNYCMPEEQYVWLPRQEILRFEEIERLVGVFAKLGVKKVRLTGGEPLLRRNLENLVERVSHLNGIDDLALTTNATQLESMALPLRQAGLQRITVSLDTLQRDRFKAFARRDELDSVIAGIRAAASVGFQSVKINTVVMKDFNDDELLSMIEFGKEVGAEVRFIEYMDVGGATRWKMEKVVSKSDILCQLEEHCGPVQADEPQGSAPAQRFRLADGTALGIIASVTEPFCSTCDRGRITADGMWYLCLYGQTGLDLKQLLREEAADEELAAAIRQSWQGRDDRGAEVRAGIADRSALFQVEELKEDPHREMHTRGG